MRSNARRAARAVALCLVAVALWACAPVASTIRDALTADDGARLLFAIDGIVFAPGSEDALAVVLVVRGDELASTDERCKIDGRFAECRLGNVTGEAYVHVTGRARLGMATFYRAGQLGTVYTVFTEVQ